MTLTVFNYLDADYKLQVKKAAEAAAKNSYDVAAKTVDAQTFALMVTCDAKDGWSYKEYDGLKCEGDLVKDFSAGWGKCVKSPSGKDYVKITGAVALKAAAAALVAFAGSQF